MRKLLLLSLLTILSCSSHKTKISSPDYSFLFARNVAVYVEGGSAFVGVDGHMHSQTPSLGSVCVCIRRDPCFIEFHELKFQYRSVIAMYKLRGDTLEVFPRCVISDDTVTTDSYVLGWVPYGRFVLNDKEMVEYLEENYEDSLWINGVPQILRNERRTYRQVYGDELWWLKR